MKAKDIIEKYIKKSMRDNVDVIVLKFDSSTQEHTIHHLLAKEELPKKGCGITVIRIREAGYTGKVGK